MSNVRVLSDRRSRPPHRNFARHVAGVGAPLPGGGSEARRPRAALQTSQQLSGEVAELELESALRAAFPTDQIEPVEKGRTGADVIHTVLAPGGMPCGVILWESKRTKSFSYEWLPKNRADQRTAGAQIGVIVTTVMPKNIEGFGRVETVWVCTMRYSLALAVALRLILIETKIAQTAAQGRDGKMERMYEYLTGVQFRQHVSSIVEACVLMGEDDEAEVRAFNRQAAKRKRRRELLVTEVARMWGDLQAIGGRSIPELHGLSVPSLGEAGASLPDQTEDGDQSGRRSTQGE